MKKVLPLVLLLVMLVSVSLVAAEANTLPGSGWESGQQIQNASTSNSATIVLTAYDQTGNAYSCDPTSPSPLPAGASFTWLPTDCSAPAGFVGSAVASADQPINAVVNVNNRTVGPAAGQYTGTAGADVATTIAFPLVKHNHASRTTTFYIQNATASPNDITATFTQSSSGNIYTKTFNDVPANAMVVVNPADATPAFPSGTGPGLGSLVVTGTGAIAGSSLEHEHSAAVAQNLQASRGFTPNDYDDTLYCPLARQNYGPLNASSGLQVQNVSGAPLDIFVTYTVIAGPHAGQTLGPYAASENPVSNGASANFLADTHLDAGDLASVKVESTGNLVAITNDRADGPTPKRFTTYACFGENSATTTITLPLVKEDQNAGGRINTTGVQVQNVGNAAATFTLTYKTTTGVTVSFDHTDTVLPGASKTFYRVANNGTSGLHHLSGSSINSLNGTISGVTITSDQPIFAIANESTFSGSAQDTKNYEGFNQ